MTGVAFEPGLRRLHVVDHIENTHFELRTPERIDPSPVPDEQFRFPVGGAVEFEASRIDVPQFVALYVWDLDIESLVRTTTAQEETVVDPGTYEIDLTNTPMKLYLQVDGGVEVTYDDSATVLSFDGTTTVRLGARSLHDQPAGTVVTTEDPEDLMTAVSAFGSAMKTFSPERSFPTLRGQPPEVAIGSDLYVPAGVAPPETGVEVGVHRDVQDVFAVSTLAYYLGATVVPTDGDRYVAAAGVRRAFDRGDGFEAGVREVLERQFVFDCVLRTEGLYDVDLRERDRMEAVADIDVAELYDAPLAERVARCFALPDEAFDTPAEWHLLTDVDDDPETVELLPFFAGDLSQIRTERERRRTEEVVEEPPEISDFFRGDDGEGGLTRSGDGTTAADRARSGCSESAQSGRFALEEVVTPPETDALEHFWAGEYFPIGAAKPTKAALRRRFDHSPTESGQIDVTVVCNDENMREESDALYGFRDMINLDLDVHFDLTTDELEALLAEPTDFLHYIGHVDEAGMRCPDGAVDLKELDETGVRAFFLNACQSYEQGLALLDNGAQGGIVTVAEVYDSIASKFGRRVARLLDAGFDLLSAMDVGQDGTLAGGSYAVVGDGRQQLCRATDGMPVLYSLEQDGGTFEARVKSYPTLTYNIGTMGTHYVGDDDEYHIASGVSEFRDVDKSGLQTLLSENGNPLQLRETLKWSGELELDSL